MFPPSLGVPEGHVTESTGEGFYTRVDALVPFTLPPRGERFLAVEASFSDVASSRPP